MMLSRCALAVLLAAMLAAGAGCDDPGLPRFANPPPFDAGADGAADGLDGGADEDGGPGTD